MKECNIGEVTSQIDKKLIIKKPMEYANTIIFDDEDMIFGSKVHNYPLFVCGYAREQKVNRILIDDGFAVNILSLRMIKELGIPNDELVQSRLIIQGFNQGGQRSIGNIRLNLLIVELSSSALFHIIDAKKSYNMLLGRPWIHENRIFPSSLCQCFKYCRDSMVKEVFANDKFFTEDESYFADTKFYLQHDAKKREPTKEGDSKSKAHIQFYVPKKEKDE